jgi:hypothetical protein
LGLFLQQGRSPFTISHTACSPAPLLTAFGSLDLDLSYLDFDGYPNFNTFLSSLQISYEVGAGSIPMETAPAEGLRFRF